MFSPERLTQLGYAYDLDCGGYEWENVTDGPLASLACVVWDDPDLDHVIGYDAIPREHRHGSCALLALAPNSGHWAATVWPERIPYDDECDRVLVASGHLYETDHECMCHGRDNDGEWEYTGDASDAPHPGCQRCDGDGYVTSDGGEWAFYVLEE